MKLTELDIELREIDPDFEEKIGLSRLLRLNNNWVLSIFYSGF